MTTTARTSQLSFLLPPSSAPSGPPSSHVVTPAQRPAPKPAKPIAEPVAAPPPPERRVPPAVLSMTTSKTRALIDAIRAELGPATRVVLTDNRSTLLSQTTRGGARTVRVHQMFLDAPPEVRTALARYLARQDPRAGKLVDAFVQGLDHLLDHVVRPFAADAHKGAVHDLLPIYVDVNARYFAHAIRAEIGWGLVGHVAKRSRRTITLGSYDARAERIVIHPALDQPHVPPLCVARIVHHEMLHAKHGEGRDAAGRRIVHGPAFRAEEALFEGALEADRWIAQHLDALLRFGAKRRGPRGDRR